MNLPARPPITLQIDDMALQRGGRVLTRGLSLRLGPGEALIARGPNGAGKTSLLRALAGFTPLAGGAVHYADPQGQRFEAGQIAAYYGHADGLRPQETPRRHARFFATWFGGHTGPGAVEEALAALGLTAQADTPARRLSAGQRRRAALSRLAVSGRPVWLLDEPHAALDTDGAARLDALIAAHRAAGGLVVAAVHGPAAWPDVRTLRFGIADAEAPS